MLRYNTNGLYYKRLSNTNVSCYKLFVGDNKNFFIQTSNNIKSLNGTLDTNWFYIDKFGISRT